jgi:hypothetical protein
VIHTEEPDFLNAVLSSSCLAPSKLAFLNPYIETQFGWEANLRCIAGRPFLDSISPVTIDPANPYLSFKLNDVDVFLLPEDRFQQATNDPELKIQNGPRSYLYLETRNLKPEQVLRLTGSLDVKQAAAGALNDHLEVEFSSDRTSQTNVSIPAKISFLYPSEFPYRLIGERLTLQFQEAGVSIDNKTPATNAPVIELESAPMEGSDFDVFRYHLLKDRMRIQSDQAWFDEWDRLESSGVIVPLLIHISRVAVRKSIQDIGPRADGFPDFANCWILQKP